MYKMAKSDIFMGNLTQKNISVPWDPIRVPGYPIRDPRVPRYPEHIFFTYNLLYHGDKFKIFHRKVKAL